MTLQQYFGQIPITDSSKDFTVDAGGGAVACALTTGLYFIEGYTAEVTDQLCEHMQAVIRAAVPGPAPADDLSGTTVDYDSSSGFVVITFMDVGSNPVTTDIAWTDTDLQTLLGFTGAQNGVERYTATYSARGVWRPTYPLSQYPGDLTEWWVQRSTSISVRSGNGVTTTREGNMLYDGEYQYKLLPDTDVLTTNTTVWATFEKFWETVIHPGYRIRCYPDRTLNAATNVKEAVFANNAGIVGSQSLSRTRFYHTVNGWWNVNLLLHKYVSG